MGIIKTETKQKTIAKEVTLEGVGLHTGANVKLKFKPGAENSGFLFERVDLEGSPLAALVGLDVDNAVIELNASEPPIMDGSSKFFVEAIEKAGVVEQDAFREEYVVPKMQH